MSAAVAPFKVFRGARRQRRSFKVTAAERDLIEQIRHLPNGVDKVQTWVGFLTCCQSLAQSKRQ